MVRTRILADDLSGAAELAGLAYGRGLTAEVQRHPDTSSAADTIAIDTASRQLAPDAAADRLRLIMGGLGDFAGALLYKKVDSLLRGNVRAEIEAIMRAGGYRQTILVPANPSRGRVISQGRYLINGRPLDETPLASDPHHPRRSASIVELLGEGTQPLHLAPTAAELPDNGIIIPDVRMRADLNRLASQLDQGTLAAGAADFFDVLLETRPGPSIGSHHSSSRPLADMIAPPALLVCGSRISWPARREAAQAANLPVFEAQLGGGVIADSQAHVIGFGDREASPQMALDILSRLASEIIRNLRIQTVLVEGGDTAAALAERMGWTRFNVEAAAPGGVGVLRPVADSVPLVLIKPGSYAWPEDIWHAFVACNG